MEKHNQFIETLVKLKSDIIDEISNICDGRELEFKRRIIFREFDDQFSEHYYRINKNEVVISTFEGEYVLNLIDDFEIRDLLVLLKELEKGRYLVFEENGEE